MKVTLFLLGLCLWLNLSAQDPIFSQYYSNRVYLNPAFAGVNECFTARLNYRSQWDQTPGGFETYSATFEFFVPAIRLGIAPIFLKDSEGAGHLSTHQAGLTVSAFHPVGERSSIHIGALTSYVEKIADFGSYIFSDQLDPISGIYDPITGLPTPTAAPAIEKIAYPDLSAGVLFRSGFDLFGEDAVANIGFAYHHILTPEDALSEIGSATQPRFNLHLGATLPIWVDNRGSQKYHLYISPQFLAEWHQQIKSYSLGSFFLYRHIFAGAFIRFADNPFSNKNTNAVVGHFGFEIPFESNILQIGFSYDINYSGLSTRPGSVWELSLVWQNCRFLKSNKGNRRLQKGRFTDCPKDFQ